MPKKRVDVNWDREVSTEDVFADSILTPLYKETPFRF